jgi:hypothetical protein
VVRKALVLWVNVAAVSLAFTGPSFGAEVEPCFDFEEALTTRIEGEPAIEGSSVEVVITRKAADADTPITNLAVAVDDDATPAGDPPPVGQELRVAVSVSAGDRVVIAIAWQQGAGAFGGSACGGYDTWRIDLHPSRQTLERYISLVARAQSSWNRHLRRRARCVEGLDQRDPESLRAAARCLDQARAKDRTSRMYRAITPPGVLRSAHRDLVASAALRVTWEKVAANTFRRAARFFERPTFYFAAPAVPTGIRRNRARWRDALTKEARISGAMVPSVLQRVGTEGQF